MISIKNSAYGMTLLGSMTLAACQEQNDPSQEASRLENTPSTAEQELYLNPIFGIDEIIKKFEQSDAESARLLKYLASQPSASWLGEWSGDVEETTREIMTNAAGKIASLVIYRVPDRDCGQHSSGGASSLSEYQSWIDGVVKGIGRGKAIIILEPDALPLQECLAGERLERRYAALNYAVKSLKANPNTKVYIDAGHSSWLSAEETAKRLKEVGIEKADGFALNTSNYQTTESNVIFGKKVVQALGMSKGFVIDTSRNGNGPKGVEWCNPRGRALGKVPTLNPNLEGVDALLWIKRPGESDGSCNGGPEAGKFWPEYAIELAKNAKI